MNGERESIEAQILKGDRLKKWGDFKSLESRKLFVDPVDEEVETIRLWVGELSRGRTPVLIGDIGGANGWVSKKVIQQLPRGSVSVEIVDVDRNKFSSQNDENIKFLHHDIRGPLPRKYDICFSRLLLHYLPKDDQRVACSNIVNALNDNGRGMVVDVCPIDAENQAIMSRASSFIMKIRGTNKRFLLLPEEYKGLFAGFPNASISFKEYEIIKLSPDVFYKERYDLTEEEVQALNGEMGGVPARAMLVAALIETKRSK